MTESEELPCWTTMCGTQTLRVVRVVQADGTIAWDVDNGRINRLELYFPTLGEAIGAFNLTKSIIESDHQNNLGCCVNPDYTLGPTREVSEPEPQFAYATPCAKHTVSIVRKTTMTGRDVWDVTNGHDDHPVALMYETFESAKDAYETAVACLKLQHFTCCIISDQEM